MRSVAKWTLAAEGAVGAALISGGPLLAVGQVHGVPHSIIAGLGLLAALGGVGIAIWSTTKVLTPRLTTPATLALPALARFRETVEESPEQFFGVIATNVDGLLRYQKIAVKLARLLAAEKDPGRRAKIEAQLRRATRNAMRADPFVRWLLTAAHAWLVEQELQRSRRFTLAGGVLVVAGAVLFFTVTASSGPTYVPVLTPQITAVPSPIPSITPTPTATPSLASRSATTLVFPAGGRWLAWGAEGRVRSR
jgi:hypothetical protein